MKLTKWLCVLLVVCAGLTGIAQASSAVVISQVYGGGGQSGSTYKNDFIELFNRSTSSVSVAGWTVQYASSGGSTWERITLTGSIGAGRYFLVAAGGSTTGGTVNLPGADVTGTTNLSATSGKVALVNSSSFLSGTCPTRGVVDFVGYGSASCAEGTTVGSLTNTTAAIRTASGCNDTDSNDVDFSRGSPNPRNSSSPQNSCGTISVGPPATPPAVTATSTPTIGTAPLIFPHLAVGGGYQTFFTFNNLSSTSTTVFLTVFSQSGTTMSPYGVTLAANGSGRITLQGSGVGWAHATVFPAAHVIGTETIQLFNGQGILVMEAGVLAAQPDTLLRLPAVESNEFGTGVAVVNLGSSPTTVNFVLRSFSGATVNSTTRLLNPNEQTAKYVNELFPGTNNFEGTLEVTGNGSLAAVAFRLSLSLGIFSTIPVSPVPTETYFSPNVGIASRLVQEIDAAQTSIDIAIYSFTLNSVGDALIEAKGRGVQIRIFADSSQANNPGSEIARLEAQGFQLKRTDGGGGGILHDKYAIFDGRVVMTGSYNWSTSAEQSNDENAVFIRDRSVISSFQQNFDAMWNAR